MQEDTVLLSLKKYHELIEAQKKVNEPRKKTVLIESNMFGRYECQTDDESTEKLADDLKTVKAQLAETKAKLRECITVDDIKKMSCREFKKWKREKLFHA